MTNYKITVTYDEAVKPNYVWEYSDELQAHKEFAKYIDWGFADEYATVNLYTPAGKCYTKIFYRKDRKVVEK
jgi:hypothetical protein